MVISLLCCLRFSLLDMKLYRRNAVQESPCLCFIHYVELCCCLICLILPSAVIRPYVISLAAPTRGSKTFLLYQDGYLHTKATCGTRYCKSVMGKKTWILQAIQVTSPLSSVCLFGHNFHSWGVQAFSKTIKLYIPYFKGFFGWSRDITGPSSFCLALAELNWTSTWKSSAIYRSK